MFNNNNSGLINDINENGSSSSGNYDKLSQCDYTLLFSHLRLSIQFDQLKYLTHQFTNFNNQNSINANKSDSQLYIQQSASKLCIAIVALVFGLFYSIIGYRFLKLATFIIGFSLGSSIIYLILSEQKQLTIVENLIISLSIGVLFAFVALLIQYIGLFLLGITSSISIVTCILILIDLFYTNKSAWLCIGLLFVCATLVASFTLRFQKSFTIINTSAIGCGLLLIAIDFFVENNLLLDYIFELYKVNGNSFNMFERQKALLKSSSDFITTSSTLLPKLQTTFNTTVQTTKTTTTKLSTLFKITTDSNRFNNNSNNTNIIITSTTTMLTSSTSGNSALALFLQLYSSAHARLCWYTWMIFGSYFILLIISLLIQFLCTGKSYDHRDSWQKLIKGSRKKKSANLEKIRLKSHLNEGNHHHRSNLNHNNNNNNVSLSRTNTNSDTDTITNQIDTLLLAESLEDSFEHSNNNKNTKNSFTIITESNSGTTVLNNKIVGGNGNRGGKKYKKEIENDNFEIVSFEIISPKKSKKDKSNIPNKSKSRSSQSRHQNNQQGNIRLPADSTIDSSTSLTNNNITNNNKNKENLASVSTTSSTASSSSTSSTCQLLPIKLNNNNNNTNSLDTTTTGTTETANLISNSTACSPSAPPQPTVPQATAIAGALIPPPIPTSIPPNKTSLMMLNQSNLIANQLPLQINSASKNLSKLKHHRNSATKDKDVSVNEKFRYFYQIRRNNGDVLSQDFMNNLQTKLCSSSNLNTAITSSTTAGAGIVNNEVNSPKSQRSSSLNSSEKKKKKN